LTQISAGWQPAKQPLQCSVVFRGTHLPVQQSSPSAHSLPQRPQLRRLKLTFVHAPRQQRSSGPQQVLRHLISPFGQGRPRPSGGAAQATPEMEATAAPTRAAPMSRSALPRERVPSASPLASSSKECAPPLRLSDGGGLLLGAGLRCPSCSFPPQATILS
jgi:hypothetical protein